MLHLACKTWLGSCGGKWSIQRTVVRPSHAAARGSGPGDAASFAWERELQMYKRDELHAVYCKRSVATGKGWTGWETEWEEDWKAPETCVSVDVG